MSYEEAKQIISGKVQPWQKLMDSALSMGAGPLIPRTSDEVKDLGNVASSVAADYTTVPFTDLGPRKFMDVPEPETEYGQQMKAGLDIAPLVVGGVQGVRGISNGIRKAEIGKVKDIQKKFGPWVKKYTKEYGDELRAGIKSTLKNPQGALDEVKKIFNPLRRSDQYQDLPAKTRTAIDKVYDTNAKPRDVLNAANRLRKSPQAKKFDELGSMVRDAGNKLKGIIKKQNPKFAQKDREYAEFSGVRKVMEKFKPGNKGQGDYGTQAGTKILHNIKKAEPGDISAMERFGRENRMDIVGPAKLAANVRGAGNAIGKALPWAGGGGAGYLLLKKLFDGVKGDSGYNV